MSEDNQQVPPDPIYNQSLSIPIAIAALALLCAVAFAIYDEAYRRRPYKAYQKEFVELYSAHLDRLQGNRANVEQKLKDMGEFLELNTAANDIAKQSSAAMKAAQDRSNNISAQLRAVNGALKDPRSRTSATNWKAEHAAEVDGVKDVYESAGAAGYLETMRAIQAEVLDVAWTEKTRAPAPEAAEGETQAPDTFTEERKTLSASVADLETLASELIAEKAELQQEMGRLAGPVSEANGARDRWLAENMADLSVVLSQLDSDIPEQAEMKATLIRRVREVGAEEYLTRFETPLSANQIAALKAANDDTPTDPVFGGEIREIFIREANWVDRCETCHMGMRSPVPIDEEDVEGKRLFISHPRPELLATHDPERFGCSMCHNGNGVAITAIEYAHGLDHHWLHRLHPEGTYAAGCIQCHEGDIHLDDSPMFNRAKGKYLQKGCWGCHPRDGYGGETKAIGAIDQRMGQLAAEIAKKRRTQTNLRAVVDPLYEDEDNDDSAELADEMLADMQPKLAGITAQIAVIETEMDVLRAQARDLWQQKRNVGPNLKEISLKTTPKWLSMWIKNHRQYRPDSKMPAFRFVDEQWKDISAFVWQQGFTAEKFPEVAMESQPRGNGARGEELFNSIGCLSCHAMGEGEDQVGGKFAANLSNLGEKLDYDWLIRWLDHPRERLVPYYPAENRDLPASEWQTRDDIDPDDLVWSMFNVMPSFRLDDQSKRDIATYLLSQQGSGAEYEDAPWVTETERFETGKELTKHFGCAGCHEISGLENENKIGMDLTTWASRPRDLLDFGHYTVEAQRGTGDPLADWRAPEDPELPVEEPLFKDGHEWYNHLGFEMHKLAKPNLFDEGRNLYDAETGEGNPLSLSRMPDFGLTDRDILDIASFVIGSVDTASRLPDDFKYTPEGRAKAIQEGWWVVKKYNCQSCHTIVPGETPLVADVWEKLKGEKPTLEQLPPSLVGTGFRTQPGWLAKFLRDPSLGGGNEEPKSVRPHLEWRMPTFSFSDEEIRKLVAFFDALSAQPTGYEPPEFVPLTPEERPVADAIFKSAKCQECHVLDGQPITSEHKAPNLSWARERLRPEWMYRWIQAPSDMQPGTAMTTLFEEGENGIWQHIDQSSDAVKNYTADEISLMVRYVLSLGRDR